MTARIVDKKAKSRLILKAALKVFAQKGLNEFRMIEIAEEAGVGKGTLYEYFPSKDDLIIGCFTEFMAEFDEYIMTRTAGLTDPVEKLKRLISAAFEFCLADPALLDTLFDFYAAGIPRRNGKSLLPQMAPMYQQMISHVATIIEEGVDRGVFRPTDSRSAASIVLALIDGITFQLALQAIEFGGNEMANRISDLVLNGLLKYPTQASGHQGSPETT